MSQGAFDVIHLGIYCRSVPDLNLIHNTIFKLLMQLGWSPERPVAGVCVVIFGTPVFCQHIVSFSSPFPFYAHFCANLICFIHKSCLYYHYCTIFSTAFYMLEKIFRNFNTLFLFLK